MTNFGAANRHNNKFKPIYSLIVLVIAAVVLVSINLYVTFLIDNTDSILYSPQLTGIRAESTESELAADDIIFALAHPLAAIENINASTELSDEFEYIAHSDIIDELPTNIKEKCTTSNNLDTLEKDQIAFAPYSYLSGKTKVLTVNNLDPLSKEFSVGNYPLTYSSEKDINKQLTRILATGEIIPARAVDRIGLNVHNDYTYLYDSFKQDMKQADVLVGLLESPLLGDPTPCTGCTTFVADDQNARGMASAGFDIVSFASNHAGDAGQAGFENTLAKLKQHKIQTFGAGNSDNEVTLPVIKNVNNLKLGFVGADEIATFYHKPEGAETFGTNSFYKNGNIDQEELARINQIKSEAGIDYLIAYLSWGVEYTDTANSSQTELAHALIDNGVDIILGSHPHWVQNVEFYKGKPIFYSLGNFIFDQTHTQETREGVLLDLYLDKDGLKSFRFMPHLTCGYHQTNNDLTEKYLKGQIAFEVLQNNGEDDGCVYWQPQRLSPDQPEYQNILDRISKSSVI